MLWDLTLSLALHNAVRATIIITLLKTEDALLESALYKILPLPKMILKLSETFGDKTNHSCKIMTSDNLPAAYACMQHLLLICRGFYKIGKSQQRR